MRIGIDGAFAGTTADFNLAAQAGVEWVGEYFGGAGCYHVWTNNDRAALAASRIPYRLPIWVPDQRFSWDATHEAEAAIAAFRAVGFSKVMALDAEQNSGFTVEWGTTFGSVLASAGIVPVLYHGGDKQLPPNFYGDWLASWIGNPPTSLPSRKAQQYRGNTISWNMSVDFSVSSDDFPLEGLPITYTGGTMDFTNLPKGKLNAPITCAIEVSTRDGGWLIASDGGVFTWGTAQFHGSASGVKLAAPIVAALVAKDDKGYTLIGSDGGTFRYGSGPNVPSLA